MSEQQYEIETLEEINVVDLANKRMAELMEEMPEPVKAESGSGMPSLAEVLTLCGEIFESSPTAQKKLEKLKDENESNHPLSKLEIGYSYTMQLSLFSGSDLQKVRNAVGMWATRNNRRFAVIQHKDCNILEIARLN